MQLAEVGKLLTIIASFDNRRLEESTARAWKMMLDREVPDAELDDATEVVLDWFANENPYFEVRHLVTGLKRKMRIANGVRQADVRSAKARGLIGQDWPEGKPVPRDVRVALSQARARDKIEQLKLEGEYDPSVHGTVPLEVGRRVE